MSIVNVGGTQLKTTGSGQVEEVSVKREPAPPGSVAYTVSVAQESTVEEGNTSYYYCCCYTQGSHGS